LYPRLTTPLCSVYSDHFVLLDLITIKIFDEYKLWISPPPPPSVAKVKNSWSCTSTPPYIVVLCSIGQGMYFMAWYLVKHRENFTFTIGGCSTQGKLQIYV
jgi:hypothetical protein